MVKYIYVWQALWSATWLMVGGTLFNGFLAIELLTKDRWKAFCDDNHDVDLPLNFLGLVKRHVHDQIHESTFSLRNITVLRYKILMWEYFDITVLIKMYYWRMQNNCSSSDRFITVQCRIFALSVLFF
jgi:hypothetical protein